MTAGAIQLAQPKAAFPRTAGQPIPPAVLQKMEILFGTRLHDVRIHTGPHVAALGAQAFTQGNDIHFAPGEYNPATAQGQQLIARQLTHVVQQRSGRARNPFGSGVAVVSDSRLDNEAERVGQLAARDSSAVQPFLGLTGVSAYTAIGFAGALGVAAVGWAVRDVLRWKYKSKQGLKDLRARTNRDDQGTTAFVHAWGSQYYMFDQENCKLAQQEMEAAGVTYVDAGSRHTGWHAEMRFLAHFAKHKKVVRGSKIWVSKLICQKCAAELRYAGVFLGTAVDARLPSDDWVHWKDMIGEYRGEDIAYQGPERKGWGSGLRAHDAEVNEAHYGDLANAGKGKRVRKPVSYI